MTAPVFVVVGHPNKGKSSIVATLAQDEDVGIADESGTTTAARHFPMRVDDEVLYTLVDTPGFQRPRRVLAWLEAQAPAAPERPATVSRFVEEFAGSGRYTDECELLAPIMAAPPERVGILYVVDGSVPYSNAYEAEMEVLRWSGRPRMALVNPIGEGAEHVAEWEVALGQFFSMVRVFDAVGSGFERQVALLRTFAELNPGWRAPMLAAVGSLEQRRERQQRGAHRALARLLIEATTHVEMRRIGLDETSDAARDALVRRFRRHLVRAERECRIAVEALYGYTRLERDEAILELLDTDLFDESVQRVFGLTRAQAARVGALGGAGAGFSIDLATIGSSLGLAALTGGVAGAAAGWFGYGQLTSVEVVKLARLGVQEVRVGPLANPSVRQALLTRGLAHHRIVSTRTHATRGALGDSAPGAIDEAVTRRAGRLLDEAAKAGDDVAKLSDIEQRLVEVLTDAFG